MASGSVKEPLKKKKGTFPFQLQRLAKVALRNGNALAPASLCL